jgi:phage I-like protein
MDLMKINFEKEKCMGSVNQQITVIMGINPGAPDEFVIFPLGQVTGTCMEPFTVNKFSVESIRANHRTKGADTVIDYEHQTLTGGVAPAAGWIKDFYLKDNGLACRADWTEKAKEFLKNREYRYFSPVVGLDKDRNLVSIQSVALTNLPRGNNLAPLVMKGIETQHMENLKQQITETDREVMKRMGISEEEFLKYSNQAGAAPAGTIAMRQQAGITETDLEVMKSMGISEEDFLKYSN